MTYRLSLVLISYLKADRVDETTSATRVKSEGEMERASGIKITTRSANVC